MTPVGQCLDGPWLSYCIQEEPKFPDSPVLSNPATLHFVRCTA
jgi:hypothetical protein